jgi:hypothetical protein
MAQDGVMPQKKWPPLDPGTVVCTTQANEENRMWWTDEGWNARQWGINGSILTHRDSHGLYYEVKHPDGSVGAYDPSELKVVE